MSESLPFDRPLQWPSEWAVCSEPPPGHGDRSDRAWALASHVSVVPLVVLLLLPLVVGTAMALSVRAARAASRGAWHRYPLTLRLLS